jgi:hypothetical protein
MGKIFAPEKTKHLESTKIVEREKKTRFDLSPPRHGFFFTNEDDLPPSK